MTYEIDQTEKITADSSGIGLTLGGVSADLASLALSSVLLQEVLNVVAQGDKEKVADALLRIFEKSTDVINSATFDNVDESLAMIIRADAREQARRVLASVRLQES